MTVPVEQDFARELRRLPIGRVLLEKFAEQESLALKPLGAFVSRKKIGKLVAKDRCAAWLEDNDGDSEVDCGAEHFHDAAQVLFGAIEHAEVVEWASATEMLLMHVDRETDVLEDLRSRWCRSRVNEVVQR